VTEKSFAPADEGEELRHAVAVGGLAGARRPDHHLPEHHPDDRGLLRSGSDHPSRLPVLTNLTTGEGAAAV
jgi:hypothetical protein